MVCLETSFYGLVPDSSWLCMLLLKNALCNLLKLVTFDCVSKKKCKPLHILRYSCNFKKFWPLCAEPAVGIIGPWNFHCFDTKNFFCSFQWSQWKEVSRSVYHPGRSWAKSLNLFGMPTWPIRSTDTFLVNIKTAHLMFSRKTNSKF